MMGIFNPWGEYRPGLRPSEGYACTLLACTGQVPDMGVKILLATIVNPADPTPAWLGCNQDKVLPRTKYLAMIKEVTERYTPNMHLIGEPLLRFG